MLDLDKFKEDEKEAIEDFREVAVQLGHAIGLSVIAGTCKSSVEDEAIAAADKAWTELADKVIEFAMED